MKLRILPVKTKPPITQHTTYAIPLSIILADTQYLSWYYKNFIQICAIRHQEHYTGMELFYWDVDGAFSDVLEIQNVYYEESKQIETVKYAINAINNDKYLKIKLDSFFLSAKSAYKKHHNLQNSLLYGYSIEEEMFFALSFDANNMFSEIRISFLELANGFDSTIGIKQKKAQSGESILTPLMSLYSLLEPPCGECEDYIISTIQGYVNSETYGYISERLSSKGEIVATGINAYKEYLEFIESVITDQNTLGYHSFHLFWEHKKLMLERLQFLVNIKRIDVSLEEYNRLAEKSNVLRMKYIKSALSGSDNSIYGKIELSKNLSEFRREMEEIIYCEEAILKKMTVLPKD